MKKHSDWKYYSIIAFIGNIILVYASYFICRVAYMLENWETFKASFEENSISDMLRGSFLFDTSAILYTNALYAVMMLLPCHLKDYGRGSVAWHKAAKVVFVFVNAIALIMNLADSVYFKYTGRRTTMSVLDEFNKESNIGKIIGVEILNHWYLFLVGILMVIALWKAYIMPVRTKQKNERRAISYISQRKQSWRSYYIIHIIVFALYIPLTIAGMRGGFTTAVRPITISNANQYVTHTQDVALILNTPFSIIRTLGKQSFKEIEYLPVSKLDSIYSPVKSPADSLVVRKKNVVILIVESFAREYIGSLNKQLDGGRYQGYTPETDKIVAQSLTFDHTFCNGRKSIDGMPSILSSIPMFVEPFFLTSASLNDVSSIAGELSKTGYQTAFFHGAENGSMGFQAFAYKTGFQTYYGRTEFEEDKRFDGEKSFDGTWAIWDEPFLQYYAKVMSEMKEPFMTAVFTASSHHPFNIPEKYKGKYKDDGPNPIHKCIRYTDHAIGEFFRTAKNEPWFKNTIFVITSDHTNGFDHPEFGTDLGVYSSPIIIYDPSGEIKAGRRHCIAQQIDIMPTILNYLGYNNSYVAFGQDLFSTKDEDTWAINYNNGIYQFIKGEIMWQFDGKDFVARYNYVKDPLLKRNTIKSKGLNVSDNADCNIAKAIIQSYMQRMCNNQLVVRK